MNRAKIYLELDNYVFEICIHDSVIKYSPQMLCYQVPIKIIIYLNGCDSPQMKSVSCKKVPSCCDIQGETDDSYPILDLFIFEKNSVLNKICWSCDFDEETRVIINLL